MKEDNNQEQKNTKRDWQRTNIWYEKYKTF